MVSIGIIGGSGMETWPDAEVVERRSVTTPFGVPSAPLVNVRIGAVTAWFLSRHGDGHDIAPHRINYRANIDALSAVGCRRLIALNAVGIVGDRVAPGGLLLPDQLIDYTWGRESSFFDGTVEPLDHVDVTEPFSAGLRGELLAAAAAAGMALADGGTYGVTQGPRLETRAEVDRLARDGVEVIGMTAMPEAALARERGLDYACVALVVNRAAGRGTAPIHDELAAAMAATRERASELVRSFLATRA